MQVLIYFAIASISATLGFFACALFAARKINRLENCNRELKQIVEYYNGKTVDGLKAHFKNQKFKSGSSLN